MANFIFVQADFVKYVYFRLKKMKVPGGLLCPHLEIACSYASHMNCLVRNNARTHNLLCCKLLCNKKSKEIID
jgi:hypothetical protein